MQETIGKRFIPCDIFYMEFLMGNTIPRGIKLFFLDMKKQIEKNSDHFISGGTLYWLLYLKCNLGIYGLPKWKW